MPPIADRHPRIKNNRLPWWHMVADILEGIDQAGKLSTRALLALVRDEDVEVAEEVPALKS